MIAATVFGVDHLLALAVIAGFVLAVVVAVLVVVSRPEPEAIIALANYRRQMEALSAASSHDATVQGPAPGPTIPAGFAAPGADASGHVSAVNPGSALTHVDDEEEEVEQASFELNANFPGQCSRCNRPFEPGTPITMVVNGTKRTRHHRQCLLPTAETRTEAEPISETS